jgi:hypothetical protein
MTTVTFSGGGELDRATVNAGIGSATIVIITGFSHIGPSAFLSKPQIKSVTIGNSVTFLDEGVFENCTALSSVTLGNSVAIIGNQAFQSCSSLPSITIPNSVTSIGTSAFTLSGLTTVYISKATGATLRVSVPATNITFFGKSGVNTLLPLPQPTITFPNINASFGDPPINPIIYTSNSNGAVTYTSSNT